MRKRILRRNVGNVADIAGADRIYYVATLINPVDHKLYDVVQLSSYVFITTPAPSEHYTDTSYEIPVYGKGSFDEDDGITVDSEIFYRSHSPSGVAKKKVGLGLMLYCGNSLSTVAATVYGDGIYSVQGDRSDEAGAFWNRQAEEGLAVEGSAHVSKEEEIELTIDESMLDMCVINCDAEFISAYPDNIAVTVQYEEGVVFQTLPAENVAEHGLVLAWDEDNSRLDTLMYDWEAPPSEILLELDLSTVSNPTLIKNILDWLESDESVSKQDLKRVLSKLSSGALPANELREISGQQRLPYDKEAVRESIMANRPRRRSAAWNAYFGALAVPLDESL